MLRDSFHAPDINAARSLVKAAVKAGAERAPNFATWLEQNIAEGMTFFTVPRAQGRRLRTTNGRERIDREILSRIRVVSPVPNPESGLRRVTAVLQEIHEEWRGEEPT